MRRKGWQPPRCSSGKVAYRTRGRALYALRVIAAEEAQAAVEREGRVRATYRCPECGVWHLTRKLSPGAVTIDLRAA